MPPRNDDAAMERDGATAGDHGAAPGSDPHAEAKAKPGTEAGSGVVTVTTCEDGPLLVRGAFELVTQDGESIPAGRATVALCRCGLSSVKPFCDGSHKAAGFKAASEPDLPG